MDAFLSCNPDQESDSEPADIPEANIGVGAIAAAAAAAQVILDANIPVGDGKKPWVEPKQTTEAFPYFPVGFNESGSAQLLVENNYHHFFICLFAT